MPIHARVRRRPEGIMLRTPSRQAKNEAIEALQLHAGLVIQSAARVLGSLHEAEDLAQDLAERLLRKPPRDVQRWPALLKTMAVNAAIDRLRRRRETRELDEATTEDGPFEALAQDERADLLRRALAQLSERDATLYSLYYLADLSQADLAHQLDMTPTAVGVALHRVRQRLSKAIAALVQAPQGDAS